MPRHTQPIHRGTDPHGVVHHYCLLPLVEIFLHGQPLEIIVNNIRVAEFTALLDTGASNTFIGQGMADHARLQRLREENATMGHGSAPISVYETVNFRLPHGLGEFPIQPRTSGARYVDLGVGYQMIIGMDILNQGIFCIDGFADEYALTFPD
jgi:hypothetical protein